ncbi:hypothetical protein [Leisingera aquaemixtae]|nr:hypothetical protein [Leisingera aquaemixtae]
MVTLACAAVILAGLRGRGCGGKTFGRCTLPRKLQLAQAVQGCD